VFTRNTHYGQENIPMSAWNLDKVIIKQLFENIFLVWFYFGCWWNFRSLLKAWPWPFGLGVYIAIPPFPSGQDKSLKSYKCEKRVTCNMHVSMCNQFLLFWVYYIRLDKNVNIITIYEGNSCSCLKDLYLFVVY